jgi:hypothetical protein
MARYQPALLGGLFIGVLSALPGVNVLNACCCLWVVSGGLLTTYLLQQNDPLPIETSTAAVGGLIAGAVGAIVSALLSGVVMMVTGGAVAQREAMDQIFGQMRDVPPEMIEMIERITTGPAAALIGAMITVPIFAVFGLLGGLLGLAFFRKKPAPPAPPVQQL